jgi:Phage integrase family
MNKELRQTTPKSHILAAGVIRFGRAKVSGGSFGILQGKEPIMLWRTTIRIHDLRHSFASILVSAGASLPLIGQMLGHTQPATTARYAHLFDDPLRQAAETVGTFILPETQSKRRRRLMRWGMPILPCDATDPDRGTSRGSC